MLERYYVRPDTIDRVKASWIGNFIEQYVGWLSENGYAARTILRRIPLLMEFGEFTQQRGAVNPEELTKHLEAFSRHWFEKHGQGCKTEQARKGVVEEAKNPVKQMLDIVIPGFEKRKQTLEPFRDLAPNLFAYLREDRGLRPSTLIQYKSHLSSLENYLKKIGLMEISSLSPVIISAFITQSNLCKTSLGLRCTVLRVFFRYLYSECILGKGSKRLYGRSPCVSSFQYSAIDYMG